MNPRVNLSCPVDGNGKASKALKTDACINKGKAR